MKTIDPNAAPAFERAFRAAAVRHGIPAAAGAVTGARGSLFGCTHGPTAAEDIFAIASMTKAVTTVAALQLVESGALGIDDYADAYLPELGGLPVLEGFDGGGEPRFSAARHRVTVRQLLNHTAGFAYPWNHILAMRYAKQPNQIPFLVHEPGTRWHYGVNVDWVGKIIEAVSGLTFEDYFQSRIFRPLGMTDTSFLVPPEKLERLAITYQRQPPGILTAAPRTQPPVPSFFNGGGGLYSTAADYIRFLRMFLREGLTDGGERVLGAEFIRLMASNQVGDLEAGRIHSVIPERSLDIDLHPGGTNYFGLGFLINREPYPNGRSAGSLAWGGIRNTFYWIDPARGIAAVLLMQFLPFCDPAALAMLRDFESAVYAELQ